MNFFEPPGQQSGRGVICWDSSYSATLIDHGTVVAGLMVGGKPAPGVSDAIAGMIPRGVAEVVPARVLWDSPIFGPADTDRIAEGIDWAVNAGYHVINMSIGEPIASFTLNDAIQRAWQAGVIVCCAAGQYWPGILWPAGTAQYRWSICCGGTTKDQTPWPSSMWWTFPSGYVTISAPCIEMPKATWQDETCSTGSPRVIQSEGTTLRVCRGARTLVGGCTEGGRRAALTAAAGCLKV